MVTEFHTAMSNAVDFSNLPPAVLLCQNCSCRKMGSTKVLQVFRELAPQGVSVTACGCLGQCGSGPNAIVMPERIPYNHLQPMAVADIVKRHWSRVQSLELQP